MSIRQPALRPAVITGGVNPSDQTCIVQYTDRPDGRSFKCNIPHPFAGPGWGILAMPTVGTRVVIGQFQNERPTIVSTVPLSQFASDFENPENLQDMGVDDITYPVMEGGDIAFQSPSGSLIHLQEDGTIRLRVEDLKIDYSPHSVSSEQYVSKYVNIESGRHISGLIKRDLRENPGPNEQFFDRLFDIDDSVEKPLQQIGRNPTLNVNALTSGGALRNPGLVENHEIVYEFQRSHMAGTYAEEITRASIVSTNSSTTSDASISDSQFLTQNTRRDLTRTDVLNLGLNVPNNLIEKVSGTVVDIYGNILDINRNKIDFQGAFVSANVDLKNPTASARIDIESKLLRRSIKYHFELNARKEPGVETDFDLLDGVSLLDEATQTGYSKSRFSFDIDGEGQLKINIPASSNYGNIPLLSRYINAHDKDPKKRNDWTFRNNPRIDIQHLAFGNVEGTGVDITNTYRPINQKKGGSEFRYVSAYHDLITTATQALSPDTAVKPSISNDFTDPNANAGGRSVHANLDGSLELNVGRDVIDKKSIVLDTAGSIIARVGKDSNSNSLVSQFDGNIAIQVGGDAVKGEDIEESNSVKFFIRTNGGYHQVDIGENGIFITSAPDSNIVLQSRNNLILSANGQVLINGEVISTYGKYADNGNTIVGEQLIQRTGKAVG